MLKTFVEGIEPLMPFGVRFWGRRAKSQRNAPCKRSKRRAAAPGAGQDAAHSSLLDALRVHQKKIRFLAPPSFLGNSETDKQIVVSLSVREKVDLTLFLLVTMTLSLYVLCAVDSDF